MALNKNLINYQFKAHQEFWDLLTEEQRKGKTRDEYAQEETDKWAARMEKLAEQEANEELVDVATGRRLGKRKNFHHY